MPGDQAADGNAADAAIDERMRRGAHHMRHDAPSCSAQRRRDPEGPTGELPCARTCNSCRMRQRQDQRQRRNAGRAGKYEQGAIGERRISSRSERDQGRYEESRDASADHDRQDRLSAALLRRPRMAVEKREALRNPEPDRPDAQSRKMALRRRPSGKQPAGEASAGAERKGGAPSELIDEDRCGKAGERRAEPCQRIGQIRQRRRGCDHAADDRQ